jgi:hypothetical protein
MRNDTKQLLKVNTHTLYLPRNGTKPGLLVEMIVKGLDSVLELNTTDSLLSITLYVLTVDPLTHLSRKVKCVHQFRDSRNLCYIKMS